MKESKTIERERESPNERIVIDCAGAIRGGAARFLRELQKYLAQASSSNVQLIGLGKQLTPRWLLQRELLAASAKRRISLNNTSFINPRGQNITLLRNILQFATEEDLEALNFTPPPRLRAQIPVVRASARASQTLVVPCTRMAEQVARIAPGLANKLTVRFHPVSQPEWANTPPRRPYEVLLPIVPSPYKNLDQHIPEFLKATEGLYDYPVRLIVPSGAENFPELSSHPRIRFIGPQTSEELDHWWQSSGAVFFPTEFEAFGYPLAEARVYGRHVIAQNTAQNHEIAGRSLQPYERHDRESLRAAVQRATTESAVADPLPFSSSSYFDWLLNSSK